MPRLARLFKSAETGHERPHPRAFQLVFDAFTGARAMSMIGDSVRADVVGAEALGIPAILVQGRSGDARHVCAQLSEVKAVLARGLYEAGVARLWFVQAPLVGYNHTAIQMEWTEN